MLRLRSCKAGIIAFWGGIFFQNLLSFTSRQLESLHDLVIVWLLVILLVVLFISMSLFRRAKSSLCLDSLFLEQVWTLIPILILISVAYPRLHLLCIQDAFLSKASITLHVIRNQWNWQSERGDLLDHLLDQNELDSLASYEIPIPLSSNLTRLLVSRRDVLHSLGLPSMGVKLDSVPGRLNSTIMEGSLGLTVGSCYELCGSGHRAMPIFFLFF